MLPLCYAAPLQLEYLILHSTFIQDCCRSRIRSFVIIPAYRIIFPSEDDFDFAVFVIPRCLFVSEPDTGQTKEGGGLRGSLGQSFHSLLQLVRAWARAQKPGPKYELNISLRDHRLKLPCPSLRLFGLESGRYKQCMLKG